MLFYHGFLHIPEYMGFSKSGPQRNSQCHRNADGYQSIYKGYDAFLYGDGVNGRPNTIIYEILYDDGFGNIKYYIGHRTAYAADNSKKIFHFNPLTSARTAHKPRNKAHHEFDYESYPCLWCICRVDKVVKGRAYTG